MPPPVASLTHTPGAGSEPSANSPLKDEGSLSNAKMRLIEARMLEESYGMGDPAMGNASEAFSTNENSSLTSNNSIPSDPAGAGASDGLDTSSAALQLAYDMGKSSVGGGGQSASPSLNADPNEILAEMTSSLATLGDWKKSREKSIEEYAALYSARLDEEGEEEGEGKKGEEGGDGAESVVAARAAKEKVRLDNKHEDRAATTMSRRKGADGTPTFSLSLLSPPLTYPLAHPPLQLALLVAAGFRGRCHPPLLRRGEAGNPQRNDGQGHQPPAYYGK